MKWIAYITTYWAQITILIAAIGYFFKVILDYRYKRKEIWHTIYSQKKLDCLLKYCELYYDVESQIIGMIAVSKLKFPVDASAHKELDMLTLTIRYREAGQTLSQLRLFLKEDQFNVLRTIHAEIGKPLQQTTALLLKRTPTSLLTEEFESLYHQTLEIIHSNNKKVTLFKV